MFNQWKANLKYRKICAVSVEPGSNLQQRSTENATELVEKQHLKNVNQRQHKIGEKKKQILSVSFCSLGVMIIYNSRAYISSNTHIF